MRLRRLCLRDHGADPITVEPTDGCAYCHTPVHTIGRPRRLVCDECKRVRRKIDKWRLRARQRGVPFAEPTVQHERRVMDLVQRAEDLGVRGDAEPDDPGESLFRDELEHPRWRRT